MQSSYKNFDLSIERTLTGYEARVLYSPAGQGRASLALPFDSQELTAFPLEDPPEARARDLGGRLFEAVFNGAVRDLWNRNLGKSEKLRIRLRLDQTPELAVLPWEYLYDGVRFICLSNDTPLVHYLELQGEVDVMVIKECLKVLAVVSQPSDLPPLLVQEEWQTLQSALEKLSEAGQVELERLPAATIPQLQQALREGDYHILHFIGHGAFDDETREGQLWFEDERGQGVPVDGERLGVLLRDERLSLRLVVLNACQSGQTEVSSPFAGSAQRIAQAGVPAVIAMQAAISDEAAQIFSREFYRSLAAGYPVDAALAEARKAVFSGKNSMEWGHFSLYLRAPDSQLFQFQLDLNKIYNTLSSALPENDPTAARLMENLGQFQYYHTRLRDYKELHNYYNDLLMQIGSFSSVVASLEPGASRLSLRSLGAVWQPIALKIDRLLDWARISNSIVDEPFTVDEDGAMRGPLWAVDLQSVRLRIDELLKPQSFNLDAIDDATSEFSHISNQYMYQADKDLRETAGELYNLSRIVLGSVPDDKI